MTFYTILVIAYTVAGEPAATRLIYTSEAACSAAIVPMSQTADPAWRDVSYHCQQTGVLSATPRPKARGE